MPIECEIRDGSLVWIKNPVTGVISYVVDLSGKSFAFTLGGRETNVDTSQHLSPEAIRHATENCPFCPGNEDSAPPELFRLSREDVPEWSGAKVAPHAHWVMRVFNNLFPRIPAELTGNRNESYIVVEDPRHFIDSPRTVADLMFTGSLGSRHFIHLLQTDALVMRRALENPNISSVVIRRIKAANRAPHSHIFISRFLARPNRSPRWSQKRALNVTIRILRTKLLR